MNTYDFIIVGGGEAGLAIANILSENPAKRVVVIEAGTDQPAEASVPGFYPLIFNSTSTFNFSAQASANYSNCYKNGILPIFQGRA